MLIFDNVSIKYKNDKRNILNNISFSLKAGDCVGIIGKSGVGKTTIFNALTMQAKITSGKIKINGLILSLKRKQQWRKLLKKIGFLSQQTNLIEFDNPYLSIKRDCIIDEKWYFRILNYLSYPKRLQIYQNLDNLNILEKAYTRNDELSQGQRHRVEICKIFLRNPFLILADEPTAALDQKTAEDVIILIKEFAKKNNAILLMNIHDVILAKKYLQKIIAIKNGELYCFKETNQLTKHDLDNIYN